MTYGRQHAPKSNAWLFMGESDICMTCIEKSIKITFLYVIWFIQILYKPYEPSNVYKNVIAMPFLMLEYNIQKCQVYDFYGKQQT